MATRALTGTYDRILDEKLRVAIPKGLRKQFSQEEEPTLFVAPGMDHSLDVFSAEGFAARSQRLAQNATNRDDSRHFFRLLYSAAEEVSVDSQGRIRIPDRLVKHAELKHDIVLLGVYDHAEIWDKALWDNFVASRGSSFDTMAQTLP